jgi:hypothetical protein
MFNFFYRKKRCEIISIFCGFKELWRFGHLLEEVEESFDKGKLEHKKTDNKVLSVFCMTPTGFEPVIPP